MGIDFKVIESAILIYILIPGLIKRLEEAHEKMQPYPFFLATCSYLEPTLF